jgi:hypothetical protein
MYFETKRNCENISGLITQANIIVHATTKERMLLHSGSSK